MTDLFATERSRIAGLIWEEEQKASSVYQEGLRKGMALDSWEMVMLNGRMMGLQRARDIAELGTREI